MRYDAMVAPNPAAWLALDEAERQAVILRYHKRTGAQAGSLEAHSIVHATVETQLAKGSAHAVETMRRLREEGLDRHDAVHAMGSVLAEQMYGALKGSPFDESAYRRGLDALNAESWRRSEGEE